MTQRCKGLSGRTANEAQEERELDPRFFNNVRATCYREMASMNAWRDDILQPQFEDRTTQFLPQDPMQLKR
ncbi:hypothetical protein E2C01_027970 [Portunus trituberculatus]|uniref:Uncharacterized protein n=1 Tax=Portunus trituberculatus TaxID=210409 RepID=A0A5B7EMC8_PORTR|nr:hypothetical protein [Portunus trituberculatus]